MYQYLWDEETGGLLLTTEISKFSKEPRPVYYRELNLLGFDQYWDYPQDDSAPIMWAEANNYIYRGRKIASLKGGALHTAPEHRRLQHLSRRYARHQVVFRPPAELQRSDARRLEIQRLHGERERQGAQAQRGRHLHPARRHGLRQSELRSRNPDALGERIQRLRLLRQGAPE